MDRAEKIMTALVIVGLIAVLANSHRRRHGLPNVRLNTSAAPYECEGPAYLLSALPSHRRKDEFTDAVSYWPLGGNPYHPSDGWKS